MGKKFARQRGRILTESPAFYHINLVIGGSFMSAQMKQTRNLSILLVVEDDPCFRSELQTLLGGRYTIVGETDSVETALSLIARLNPNLVLVDLGTKLKGNRMEVLQQAREREKIKFLVLPAYQEGSEISRALQSGAKGYVFKSQAAQQLEDAITSVWRGYMFFPPEVATLYWQWYRSVDPTFTTPAEIPQLTIGELRVLQLVAEGASNEKIAKELFISQHTVKLRLECIFDKLKVPRREQIVEDKKFKSNPLINSRVQVVRIGANLGLVQLSTIHNLQFNF